jgi:hypothetical protein
MKERVSDERLAELLARYRIEVTWCEEKRDEYLLALEVYERREKERKAEEAIAWMDKLMKLVSGLEPGDHDGLKEAVGQVLVPDEEEPPRPKLADWERKLEAMEGVLHSPTLESPSWICTACGILETGLTGKRAVRKAHRKWSGARSADIWRDRDDDR